MSVTFPEGFLAGGVSASLRSTSNPDLALVVNEGPLDVGAAVFTTNRAKANPILWSMEAIKGNSVKATVLNAGGANCFTGAYGFETSVLTAQAVAALVEIDPKTVQVCSTGMIGVGGPEFRNAILDALPNCFSNLSNEGGPQAARAILTTDTVAKMATHQGEGWRIGGMAKGAGMLAPAMATMLVVITTDAVIDVETASNALQDAVELTFNRLDSDGAMSTNDQVTLMASGAAQVTPSNDEFAAGVTAVCRDLAGQLLSDAEGSKHDIAINVTGAKSVEDALEVGRSVARNNLVKTAVFGCDPNWGRILAAIGTTKADFDPYKVDVSINGVRVCANGGPDEDRNLVSMEQRAVTIDINLKHGSDEATIHTSDLTHDYVTENSAYST